MALSVNLLNDKHTLSEKDYQVERKFLQYAVVFFTVTVVLAVSLGIIVVFFSKKLSAIEDDVARGTQELAGLTEANAKQIYLKNRLQLITSFLEGRSVDREAMQRVFSFDIPGIVVSSVSFESESVLGVQLTANNSQSLEKAIETVSAPTSFFTQVVSKGISRTVDGSYQALIQLTVPRSK